jgi:hypothetical protein
MQVDLIEKGVRKMILKRGLLREQQKDKYCIADR